jgi:hypothetical protein
MSTMHNLRFFLIPCDRNKRPLTPHGEKDASDDPAVIEEWRRSYPGCNWAIATGPSGLIALDEDCYKEVYDPDWCLCANGTMNLEKTVEWRSARGGRVRIYRRQENVVVPSHNGIRPAVDVKASTGYVLIPPSQNAEGQRYQWTNKPSEVPVAHAPQTLVDFILNYKSRAKERPTTASGSSDMVFLRAGDGRWEHVRRLGGVMRREGCGYEVILTALSAFAKLQCEYDVTLRHEELERLVRWLVTNPVGAKLRVVVDDDDDDDDDDLEEK